MRIPHLLLATVLAMAHFGCATGDITRIPSTRPAKVVNSAIVQMSKDQAWAKLLSGLSGSFFVVNNIEKSSGFLNVSYGGNPEEYVDGGEVIFTVSNLRGKREYKFPASRGRAQYEAMVNGTLCGILRQLELDGRVNVLLEEQSPTSTKVTVNVRYVLTLKVSGQTVTGQTLTPSQETIAFNTGQTGSISNGTEFRATGKLEQSILDLLY